MARFAWSSGEGTRCTRAEAGPAAEEGAGCHVSKLRTECWLRSGSAWGRAGPWCPPAPLFPESPGEVCPSGPGSEISEELTLLSTPGVSQTALPSCFSALPPASPERSLLVFKVPGCCRNLENLAPWFAETNVMGIRALQAPRCEDLSVSPPCALRSVLAAGGLGP